MPLSTSTCLTALVTSYITDEYFCTQKTWKCQRRVKTSDCTLVSCASLSWFHQLSLEPHWEEKPHKHDGACEPWHTLNTGDEPHWRVMKIKSLINETRHQVLGLKHDPSAQTQTQTQTQTQRPSWHKHAAAVNILTVHLYTQVVLITTNPQDGDINPIRAWRCHGHSSKQTWRLWRYVYCCTYYVLRRGNKRKRETDWVTTMTP